MSVYEVGPVVRVPGCKYTDGHWGWDMGSGMILFPVTVIESEGPWQEMSAVVISAGWLEAVPQCGLVWAS